MKRFKDIAAIFSLAALLFSCAESVEEVADTRRPITFSSSLGRPGEGSPSKAQSPEVFSPGDGIGVFACYSGPTAAGQSFDPNFMNNQLVKFNGSAWTYSPVKYWPTNGTLEFYGYFPYNESDEIRTDGSMLVTHKCITGLEQLDKVIAIDQSPIGRTPRSNPATYTGVFDLIRDLFAATPDAKAKGYKKGRFSFNAKGGRCEACSGDGINKSK